MMTPFSRIAARGVALVVWWALIGLPGMSMAADLNTEMQTMFNNLGAIGNYTAPGAFRGQTMNTYQGGSLYVRSPTKSYQLLSVAWPSVTASCGGIDAFGGSFSHISGTEIKNMLKNITTALPGVAFQAALESVSPLLGDLTKYFQGIETWVNNARINSCEAAKSLVANAAEAANVRAEDICNFAAQAMGLASDNESAKVQCATSRATILQSARNSGNPAITSKLPYVGNFVWDALMTLPTLSPEEKEFVMNLVGTVIFYADIDQVTPRHEGPSIIDMKKLLYGDLDAGAGNVTITNWLSCDEYAQCRNPTRASKTFTPFSTRVQTMLQQISNAIQTRTAVPNNSAVIGFVNQTSIPVWRMLSVGNTIPGSGLADTLINQYRDLIAIDYVESFIGMYVGPGRQAIEKMWLVDKGQRDELQQVQERVAALRRDLFEESRNLSVRPTTLVAVQSNLEALERQLRTSMPQQVLDMLGHGAQAMR